MDEGRAREKTAGNFDVMSEEEEVFGLQDYKGNRRMERRGCKKA